MIFYTYIWLHISIYIIMFNFLRCPYLDSTRLRSTSIRRRAKSRRPSPTPSCSHLSAIRLSALYPRTGTNLSSRKSTVMCTACTRARYWASPSWRRDCTYRAANQCLCCTDDVRLLYSLWTIWLRRRCRIIMTTGRHTGCTATSVRWSMILLARWTRGTRMLSLLQV